MQRNNNYHININGNISESQIQVATANSVQNANEEADEKLSYDEVLMVLNEISKYKDVLMVLCQDLVQVKMRFSQS